MFNPSLQQESENADILRGRQLHAAEQNVERALVGSLFAATLTTVFFHSGWEHTVWAWYLGVVVVCTVRILFARRVTRHPSGPVAPAEIYKFVLWSIVTATTLTSFPLWVTMNTDGFTFAYMMALTLGTFWSASFVHAPIISTAIAFMLTELGVAIVAASLAGMDWSRAGLVALFVVGTGAALHIIRQHSDLFRQAVLQQLELENKTEVIELLLKEHEAQSSDWLWQTDDKLRIAAPSARFAEAIAQNGTDLAGQTVEQVLSDRATDGNTEALAELNAHLANRRAFRDVVVPQSLDSQTYWLSVSGRPVYDRRDRFVGYRGVMADITVARLAQARAAHLAQHDALTDLPNRAQFSARLSRALCRGQSFALLSIDLDGFKAVNDGFGHPAGDKLLVEIARRLQNSLGSTDIVARLGDDEFVIQTQQANPDRIASLCRQLIEATGQPVIFEGSEIAVGASIGIAFAPTDGATTDEILKSADSALARAKRDGRGRFRFFSAAMDRELQLQQQLIQDLRSALGREELILHYQPFIDAQSGEMTGCEALIRWHHSERGMISPGQFVPLAEESGLIVPIGDWVIEHACREAASWNNNRRVSVNVSPVQFSNRSLPERIQAILQKTGLAPNRLEIEVTETVLVEDPKMALDALGQVRALGVRVALDDFGTGYSSLSYLREFPFDKIKIDRSFVQDLEARRDSQIIVRAILDIAMGLDMTITAEGIELTEQADYLRQIGCHEFQGYLFGRPTAANDLPAALTGDREASSPTAADGQLESVCRADSA
ncbi:EAL domain-containing protein [Salinisphaera sp. SPP-AMP-43]|uniref:putative bifunctional diguanylate cyclase/phosphodiesterase n=1 Tax=Salinisphaera sp. SPP-AMP-43 TaxID=3121288 RepID=UPI003C6E44CF